MILRRWEYMARPKKSPEDRCERINVSLPPELMNRLISYCQKEERSMSWVAKKALEQYLSERGE